MAVKSYLTMENVFLDLFLWLVNMQDKVSVLISKFRKGQLFALRCLHTGCVSPVQVFKARLTHGVHTGLLWPSTRIYTNSWDVETVQILLQRLTFTALFQYTKDLVSYNSIQAHNATTNFSFKTNFPTVSTFTCRKGRYPYITIKAEFFQRTFSRHAVCTNRLHTDLKSCLGTCEQKSFEQGSRKCTFTRVYIILSLEHHLISFPILV